MPAPSPAAIVTNPRPLNPSGFPFKVVAFPAQWLLQEGDFNVPKATQTPPPTDPPNFEPGQS